MPIDEQTLTHHLQNLAPFEDASAARRAFDAALEALRSGLTDDEADWLAVDLGPLLSEPLLRQGYAGELSVNEFYRRTGRYAGLRRSAATEQAQLVCRTLAELLPQPGIQRLKKHLPELAPLFSVPEAPPPAQGPHQLRSEPGGDRPPLGGGKPGGERPVSEAGSQGERAFSGGGPVRVHSDSVARAQNPHEGTKLPSVRGLTQERERDSIASSRRGLH